MHLLNLITVVSFWTTILTVLKTSSIPHQHPSTFLLIQNCHTDCIKTTQGQEGSTVPCAYLRTSVQHPFYCFVQWRITRALQESAEVTDAARECSLCVSTSDGHVPLRVQWPGQTRSTTLTEASQNSSAGFPC